MTAYTRLQRLYALRDKVDAEILAELGKDRRAATVHDQVHGHPVGEYTADELNAVPGRRVRAWARANGITVPESGSITHELRSRYLDHQRALARRTQMRRVS